MIKLKHFLVVLTALFVATGAWCAELRGMAAVNITSDTAANAKNMAFDEATRQIVVDALRQYVDVPALQAAVANAKASELSNLILSTSIDGEQTSDTTYSANITMVLDSDAIRDWLNQNNVQNWLPDKQNQDMSVVVVNLSNRLNDWTDVNRIANEKNISLNTKNITGNIIRMEIPQSVRGVFTIAVRESGWKYTDKNGELHIWK